MIVIEYGHIKPKEVKCNHCGAILEYVSYDLEMLSPYRFYLRCPVCRERILKDNDGKELTK
jgi:ribosomal protein S27E